MFLEEENQGTQSKLFYGSSSGKSPDQALFPTINYAWVFLSVPFGGRLDGKPRRKLSCCFVKFTATYPMITAIEEEWCRIRQAM